VAEVKKVLAKRWQSKVAWLEEGEQLDLLAPDYTIFLVEINALPISASEVRERARRGESIAGLVPAAVADYIRQHRLYQDKP
jgi:nicotinic acid mononucleotide adenylyltransferase